MEIMLHLVQNLTLMEISLRPYYAYITTMVRPCNDLRPEQVLLLLLTTSMHFLTASLSRPEI